jgi:hypothetical protein
MAADESVKKLEQRRQYLATRLARFGLILQGTITERTIRGEKDKKQKPGQTYGPYYQWTFKREGKTVTVNLTQEQAQIYQKAIDNNRELELILKELREISEQILDAQTEGVRRRNTGK